METMRNWQKSTRGARKIGVLLFDRFSNHCLANAIEPLRAANGFLGRAAYDWQFMTVDGAGVTSSSGLPVVAQRALGQSAGDVLLVISSYGFRDIATAPNLRALRAAAGRFAVVAGLDTGSWLMAAAGLLDGQAATIHWDELDRFRETFPEVRARRVRIVKRGARWSCGGAMTAFELAGRMIGDDHGEALRLEVGALFMAGDAGFAGAVPAGGEGAPRAASRSVAAALALMRDHLEDPLTVPQVAQAVGLRQRPLEERFRRELGAGPQQVYRRIRLEAARRFVEQTDLRIAEIALRCGYRDASAMTRAFRAEFGTPPRMLRAQAAQGIPGSFSD